MGSKRGTVPAPSVALADRASRTTASIARAIMIAEFKREPADMRFPPFPATMGNGAGCVKSSSLVERA